MSLARIHAPVRLCLLSLLLLVALGACEGGGEMAILDLDPKVGHTQGDQYVKILGANFRQDIGYAVYFGTKKAPQVTIIDPETLLVKTPVRPPAGTVDIMIRADDGNAWKIAKAFEFQDMGGSVVEGLGADAPAGSAEEKGNLAF